MLTLFETILDMETPVCDKEQSHLLFYTLGTQLQSLTLALTTSVAKFLQLMDLKNQSTLF